MTDELRDYDRDVAQMRRDLYPRGAHTVPGADGEDMPATTGRRTARLTPPEEEFLMTWGWSVTSRYDGMHGADDWVDPYLDDDALSIALSDALGITLDDARAAFDIKGRPSPEQRATRAAVDRALAAADANGGMNRAAVARLLNTSHGAIRDAIARGKNCRGSVR